MKHLIVLFSLCIPFSVLAQNVGIGTPSPSEKLDVNGNLNVTGTIKINGVDGNPNEVIMKNGSGNLAWGSPYPPSASDKSTTLSPQTTRNTWVDDPDISLVVPSTGTYLIFFNGMMSNGNSSLSSATSFDSDGWVRIFNASFNSEVFQTRALALYTDAYSGLDFYRRYLAMRPSAVCRAYLAANDVLKIQYMQSSVGPVPPTTSWLIGAAEINILKVGN